MANIWLEILHPIFRHRLESRMSTPSVDLFHRSKAHPQAPATVPETPSGGTRCESWHDMPMAHGCYKKITPGWWLGHPSEKY